MSEMVLSIGTVKINVHHRFLTDIIKSAFEDPVASNFHMTPFEEYWKKSDKHTVKVYSEVYSSPDMLQAYQEVHSLLHEPGDDLEHVIASLMLWLDVTQLANFRDASLWPIYLYFGNQSKYIRGHPAASACHHVAYIPTLPDDFQDMYTAFYGKALTGEVYTHCKHELMHTVWELLLDEKFMDAYKIGIVVRCGDGIMRQIFPWLFSYSADYPEK
ncbi:hypothetical protein PISMIDRAFT_16501 [Pisolithus microcarpus 441]|uniref:Uncharacterized protein n=1 Tax=Pisolithus microcarpus 441 TaxID=765257 RepID=A0A0C9YFW6_9AGAM|nr:hypothetical protein PISMIDRAFT_16501 [Pisolithus microcarpus 441]